MKKTAIQIASFLGCIIILHWMGVIVFSLVTPFRIIEMTGSFVYSFVSLFFCVIITLAIFADMEDKRYFDQFN
jgi:hypothetical protein